MIKKLRVKFICIAMLSVTLVLTIIVAAMNIYTYVKIDKNSDEIVQILVDNGGKFPLQFPEKDGGFGGGITTETQFESRYFVATLKDGSISVDMLKIYKDTVNADQATEYFLYLYSRGKTHGMYEDFKYLASEGEDGTVMYVFLYCGKDLTVWRNFLLGSTLISLGGLLVVFVLIIVLSRFVLKPVEESYIKQKSFITNAGHDIKTPLTVINAEAELIEMEYGESEYSSEIKNQVSSLAAMTDKLVFLSKMEENPNFEMAEFDLSAALSEVLMPYSQAAQSKGLGFSADIRKNVKIVGSEENLKRAAALMLDNALKYTTPGGRIEVTLKKTGKSTEITFYNTAHGMEEGKHNELFERFYRGDKSRNSATSGNGIGLSAVKAIVEMHKGKISAVAAVPNEISFVVTL